MRICSPHCGIDPESISGGETYERELLQRLAGEGAVIDILLARHQRHPDGVPNWVIHRLPIGRGLRWPVAMALLPPVIRRVFAETRFDLLRVHSLRFIGPAALIARRRYGLDVPIVSHHHHLDPSPLNRLIERRVIEGSERVITVSRVLPAPARRGARRRRRAHRGRPQRDRRALRPAPGRSRGARAPRDRERARRPLPRWPQAAKEPAPPPRRLAGGRGPAARRPARDRGHRASSSACFAGAPRALGLERTVIFAGRVAEADKVGYYNAADVFVSPSSLEGFGFTVGEAMSCGLPVVVSDAGALPELVAEGEGGFLCRPARPSDFAARLGLLLDDAELRRRFGALQPRPRRARTFAGSARVRPRDGDLRGGPRRVEARPRSAVTGAAERFFRESEYWRDWSRVPDLTVDIAYALRAVRPVGPARSSTCRAAAGDSCARAPARARRPTLRPRRELGDGGAARSATCPAARVQVGVRLRDPVPRSRPSTPCCATSRSCTSTSRGARSPSCAASRASACTSR